MDSRDEVAKMAYELYEKRGCVHGYDVDDWYEAERLIMLRRAEAPEGQPAAAAKKTRAAGSAARKRKSASPKEEVKKKTPRKKKAT